MQVSLSFTGVVMTTAETINPCRGDVCQSGPTLPPLSGGTTIQMTTTGEQPTTGV